MAGERMWHVANADGSSAEADEAAVRDRIFAGSITRETWLWRPGMQDWAPADEVFGSLFTPPPAGRRAVTGVRTPEKGDGRHVAGGMPAARKEWPGPDEDEDEDERGGPVGIGGWLILPAIGLVLAPLATLASCVKALAALAAIPPASPVFLPVLVDLLLYVAVGGFGVLAAIWFFRRRRSAPRLVVTFYFAASALNLADIVILRQLGLDVAMAPAIGRVLASLVVSSLWAAYFFRSRRVRNTFTR